MKKKIKRLLRWVLRKAGWLRNIIYKLYNAAFAGENPGSKAEMVELKSEPKAKEKSIFTKKAMYSGYSIDYLNSKFLTKEERISELKRLFYNHCGYYLDIDHPKTFNQKLQWLKMNYDDPRLGRCVDKAEFKAYIQEQVGEGYTIPLFGVWDNESMIDFDALPKSFVLKSTLQSDGRHIIIVKDKEMLDFDKLKTVLSSWLLPRNSLCVSYCNAYHDLRPRILAEEYFEGFEGQVLDYKFMCFNGEAKLLVVVADRGTAMGVNFYDLDWNLLPFTRSYPNTSYPIPKPKNFDRMLEMANKLAEPFPFVRVDFYESADGNEIYVGELTFYPGGGYESFQPIEWDYKLGDMLRLPECNT